MNLVRLLHWGTDIRNQNFPGRILLGKFYKALIFSILNPTLKLAYRICLVFKEKSFTPLFFTDYCLIKKVRSWYPAPFLARRWVQSLPPQLHPSRYTDILSSLHSRKLRTQTGIWLLPETALLASTLDCKGFAVLFSALLNAAGMKNELWIGLPSDGQGGHAWVVLDVPDGRIAVDQFNGNGTDETLYLLNQLYALKIKI